MFLKNIKSNTVPLKEGVPSESVGGGGTLKNSPPAKGEYLAIGKGRGYFPIFHFSLLVFSLLLLASSCKKDDGPKPPVISLKSMSQDTLVQFQDSLDIVIRYSDEDGDLGETDPDNNTLYVKDSRLDTADYYHVQPLSPPNTALNIQGELTIKVRNMFLLGNGGNEQAVFTIKLKDRAGNWSNEITTPAVVITQ